MRWQWAGKTHAASPKAFSKLLNGKYSAIGWIAPLVALILTFYYSVIIGRSINYAGFSFNLAWGSDPGSFFYDSYLHMTDGPLEFGTVSLEILAASAIVWILIFISLSKGVKSIEKALYLTVIAPWILIGFFVIRGITLPGAMDGLAYYLTPNLSILLDPEVWIAAYAQILASVSVALGILIAYSKSLGESEDIVKSSVYVASFNCLTSIVAGIAVFSTLGYLAHIEGVPVTEVVKGGIELVFITYPAVIGQMPLIPEIFGILFFLMIVMLGIDSAFSLVESTACAIQDYVNIPQIVTTGIVCIAGFLGSVLFATGAGIYWLEIVDVALWYYLVILVALLEAFAVGYVYGPEKLRNYFNLTSEWKTGQWWDILIKYITPGIIGVLLIYYVINGLFISGNGDGIIPFTAKWIIVIGILIGALVLGHFFSSQDSEPEN